MSIIDKVKDLFTKEKISVTPTAWVSHMLDNAPKPKTKDYLKAYSEEGWLNAVVNAIAKEVGAMDFKLYQVGRDGEAEEIEEHEALDTLYYVNDFMTKTDLINLTLVYKKLTGKAFWYTLREGGKIKEIYPLRPDYITVVPEENIEDGFIKEYVYRIPGEKPIKFQPDEIIYHNQPDPLNIRDGVGLGEAAASPIDMTVFAEEWNRNFFFNNAIPNAILSIKGNVPEDHLERFKKDWQNKYLGRKKNSQLAIVGGEAELKEFGGKARDSGFLEGLKWARDKILAIAQVPRSILGITDDVNRANAEATEWIFAKRVVRPEMEAIVDTLNEFYIKDYGEDLFLDYEDPTPDDKEAKANYYKEAWNKWMTTNEIRQELGLDEVEGGDAMYFPANLLPTTGDPEEKSFKFAESKGTKPQLSKYARSQVKRIRQHKHKYAERYKVDQAKNKLKDAIASQIKQINKGKKNKFLETGGKDRYWKMKTEVDKRFEKKIIDETKRILDELKADTIGRIEQQKAPERKKNIWDWIPDREKYDKLFSVAMLATLRDVMTEAGEKTLNFMGYGANLTFTPSIEKFLDTHAKKFSDSAVTTARKRLRKVLGEGVKKGEGVPKLTRRVEKEVSSLKKSQAERIARTEVLRASNKATIEAYRQTGVVQGKEWLTSRDGTVCDWCDPMDGKIIPDSIDKNFFNKGSQYTVIDSQTGNDKTLDLSYDGVSEPPLHPNCRCTTVPVLKSDTINEDRVWEPAEIDVSPKDYKGELKKMVEKEIKNLSDKELSEIRSIKKAIDEQIKED